MSSSRITWPVMSLDSNTGTRCPHFMEARKVATSVGAHDSTEMVGVLGSPDESDENDVPDLDGVEGLLLYADAGCCLSE